MSSPDGGDVRQGIVPTLPRFAGGVVLALSAVVLLGWALQIRVMESLYPGLVTMKANTAAGLALSAIGLLYLDPCRPRHHKMRWVVATLASLVALIGVATLAEYAFRSNLEIDQLLFRADADAALTPTPGRMAAVTAFGFVLLGIGLAPVRWTRRWVAYSGQGAVIALGALALTSLLGYVYDVIPTAGLGQGVQIAPHTAVAFVLLAGGMLACRADSGWMAVVLSRRAGGTLARRLLPVAFVLPLALGALRQAGARLGFLEVAGSSATVAVVTMIAFGMIIWRTAAALNHADDDWQAAEQARFDLTLREQAARERVEAERSARAIAEQALEVAERAVREREDAFMVLDRVMESTTIGIAVFDTDLRYSRINSALSTIDGLPAESYLGRSVLEVRPEHGADLAMSLRTVFETGLPVLNREQLIDAGDGPARKRYTLTSFFPLRSGAGDLLGAAMTVLETTEQKRWEQQLRQAHKMEAVGQLAGGVAHDFNNILTVIMSYSSIVLGELATDSSIRSDIQQISDAADRAANLTRQLLAFSRQQVLEPQVIDLNDLTRELEKMLHRLLRADIMFVTRLDDELGHVSADPGQLEQVIMNLVVNARDAMPEGGRLTLETANLDIEEEYAALHVGIAPGSYVMLSVSDTGCGMDEQTQAQIFDPFFTTKEKGRGTGLGLSTVFGIVEQSGGYIRVYSELEQGTVFTVYLPRAESVSVRRKRTGTGALIIGGSETILLAEDEAPVRKVTRMILERAGYTVLEGANGPDALEIARRPGVTIDLLLTDMVMPQVSGRELAEKFRGLHPQALTVYMSGYTEDAVQQKNVFEPGTVFVQKPFTPPRLLQKVRQALDGATPGVANDVAVANS